MNAVVKWELLREGLYDRTNPSSIRGSLRSVIIASLAKKI